MLWTSLALSGIYLVIINLITGRSRKTRYGWLAGGPALVFMLALAIQVILPAFLLNVVLVSVMGLFAFWIGGGWRSFLACSLVATAAAYGLLTFYVLDEQRATSRLVELYPFESVSSRLAYEERRANGQAIVPDSASGTDHAGYLAAVEEKLNHYGYARHWALRRIHEGYVNRFINSPGFGVARIIRPKEYMLRPREAEPIPLPTPEYEDPSLEGELLAASPAAALKLSPGGVPAEDVLGEMHLDGLVDFANPEDFGYVKDRDQVAGFQPHRFSQMPVLPGAKEESSYWRIQTLELVSLLKHDEPRVYVSESLPRMDELRDAPTRTLDFFEKSRLPDLQRGADLRVHYTPERIRMLGSIRAVNECVRCHRVERGALLGAFSYKLRRTASPAP